LSAPFSAAVAAAGVGGVHELRGVAGGEAVNPHRDRGEDCSDSEQDEYRPEGGPARDRDEILQVDEPLLILLALVGAAHAGAPEREVVHYGLRHDAGSHLVGDLRLVTASDTGGGGAEDRVRVERLITQAQHQ